MYEMLTGYPPFHSKDHMELYSKICAGKFELPNFIAPEAADLLRRLLRTNKSKRLGCLVGGSSEIKTHPWFNGIDWDAISKRSVSSPIHLKLDNNTSTKYFLKYRDSIGIPEVILSSQQQNAFEDF
jgi:serine/threonine protein kinase